VKLRPGRPWRDEALHSRARDTRTDGLGKPARVGLAAGGMRVLTLSPRRASVLVLALAVLLPGTTAAQTPRPPAGSAPLRDEPGDWWGDVHRWTGSDATRPRGAAPAAAPARRSGRTVTTVRTGRANLRREPTTAAPVARVLPPGTVLTVFAEGPDGWLQVGERDRPAGWIHPSALAAP
jgi:hypothetical protein